MSIVELSKSPEEPLQPAKSTRVRLEYLDGMRGLAALYVVWFHIYLDVINTKLGTVQFPYLLHSIIEVFMSHGASSVAIFIVLSGYCLMANLFCICISLTTNLATPWHHICFSYR